MHTNGHAAHQALFCSYIGPEGSLLEKNLDMRASVPEGRGMRGTDLLEDQGPAGRLDLRCEGEGESQREAY